MQIVTVTESYCAFWFIGAMIFFISNNSICDDFKVHCNFEKEPWGSFLHVSFFIEFNAKGCSSFELFLSNGKCFYYSLKPKDVALISSFLSDALWPLTHISHLVTWDTQHVCSFAKHFPLASYHLDIQALMTRTIV